MLETTKEIWAIVNSDGEVVWSRGGSSTKSKLMVYSNEKNAKLALKNNWFKQILGGIDVKVIKIYG